jgi:hypothetical protein
VHSPKIQEHPSAYTLRWPSLRREHTRKGTSPPTT